MKDDDSSPLPAWICVLDARTRDAANKELFDDAEKALGDELLSKVSAAYDARVYRNYRENSIAVKADKPTRINKTSPAVVALDAWCATKNIEIKTHGKNIIYHIKRKKEITNASNS